MRTSGFWPGLLIAIVIVAGIDWLSARTTRLYLDKASARQATEGALKQEFKVRGRRVLPEIVGENEARFRFEINTTTPCELIFSVEPVGRSSYEVAMEHQGTRQQIAAKTSERRTKEMIPLPAHVRYVEFIQHGSMRWLDLKLARPVFLWPAYALGFAFALTMALRGPSGLRFFRQDWIGYIGSGLLCLAAIEVGLRLSSKRLPPAMIAVRRNLGAVGEDSRWFDPVRYKLRLRPNLDTYCESHYGNITRDGIIPKALSSRIARRYPFRTDAEGFRNDKVRAKIDVAAIGDSFTDGALGPVEESWPARLEKSSGLTVQNYGVSGFGPQQELYAMQDFVLKHQPRWVVVAFYAGNDLRDAEIFDRWESERYKENGELEGWELVRKYRRFETLYLWTLAKASAEPLLHLIAPSNAKEAEKAISNGPNFDRGMFSVPVADRTLRFAFLWQYLRQLSFPRTEIETSRGWQLSQQALRAMKAECEKNGAKLLLVFVPEKTQVYWPLLESSLSATELQAAINFYCPSGDSRVPIDAIRTHRLELSRLFRDFCIREQISTLDLSDQLEQEIEAGRQVYYDDDIHWNAAGQEVAARAIEEVLKETP